VSTAAWAAVAAVFGAIIGSFLNVVIHRLPRGESLARPGSRCPECQTAIKPWDNVPVVSWLVLRGRCRHCGARIAPRYPVVEALTAVLFALAVLRTDAERETWIALAFVLTLIPCAFIDLDHRIIPNKITGPSAILAIALVAGLASDRLVEHLVAGAAAGGFLLLAALAYPAGMGMGDVKLAGVMGLYLGRDVGPAMLIGLVAGSVVGALIIARKGRAEGRKTAIPFGPFLALGGLGGLFAGDEIVEWYLDTFA
jgi:leader peptidase (prepilin peptidase) / N-methyltransferase